MKLRLAPSSRKHFTSKFNAWISPELGEYEICDLKKRHIYKMLHKIEKSGSSHKYAAEFKRFLARMIAWGKTTLVIDVEGNVAKTTEYRGGTMTRNRIMTDQELALFWNGNFSMGLGGHFKLTLLCGTRLTESSLSRWKHISWRRNQESWTIPAANSKNGYRFEIPISRASVRHLRQLWDASGKPATGPIFPEIYEKAARYKLNGQTDGYCTEQIQNMWNAVGFEHEDGSPTYHDIRRNIMNGLKKLKVSKEVRNAALNHRTSGMHETHYEGGVDPLEVWDEHRDALNAWADWLADIIGPDPVLVGGAYPELISTPPMHDWLHSESMGVSKWVEVAQRV